MDSSRYIDTAIRAARAGAAILMDHFGKITLADVREKQQNDFLTFVDESAEKKIIEIIHGAFPDHGILAEETGSQIDKSRYQWIIDPLDGTKNYICGIPIFAISIGLRSAGEIIAGVVYDPVRDDLFHAVKNHGAYLNGGMIRVNDVNLLEKSLLATGFPFRYKSVLSRYMRCFEEVFRHSSGTRRMGAAAIDLAYVACGRFEGFWELGLKPWDMAAGALLISEAGGYVSDFWNTGDYLFKSFMVATNGKIHKDLLKIIQNHFPEYSPLNQDG
jgi:myo-inositol-1(or 4)-monophosphatase